MAAGLPILVALLGLGVGSAGVLLLAAVMDVSTSAPTVATMVSLGVGIDYALLLVTRHVEGLRAGRDVRDAAAHATATAGRSVVFAGGTVLVSLIGLGLAGLQTYATFGIATAIGVVSVMAAALTVVPAVLGLAKTRVLPRKVRRRARPSDDDARRSPPAGPSGSAAVRCRGRSARCCSCSPWPTPVTDLRLWPADISAQPAESTTRQANDLIDDAFGPGANGPFLVAVDLDAVPAGRARTAPRRAGRRPGCRRGGGAGRLADRWRRRPRPGADDGTGRRGHHGTAHPPAGRRRCPTACT